MFEKIKNLLRLSDLWKRVALLESQIAFFRKKLEEVETALNELDNLYATKKHEAFLESKLELLKDQMSDIGSEMKEFNKRTVSKRTLDEDTPLPTGQIINEWLNGKEEESGT